MTNPLPADGLRWRCDAAELDFETTNDVKPLVGVVGQDDAVEALRFGLETDAPGQNIFVRGLSGTGRKKRSGCMICICGSLPRIQGSRGRRTSRSTRFARFGGI